MKPLRFVALAVCTFLVVAGCAKTTVSNRQSYSSERLARPDRIIVYNFAASPADIPPIFPTAREYAAPTTPASPEAQEVGAKMGALVAKELVDQINGMGLLAVPAAGQPPARPGDIVLMGYFESVDPGSAAKRIALGFGAGAASLSTRAEGYLMTSNGLKLLGSGNVDSGGNKMPGVALPLAVTAATANPIGLVVSGAVKVGGEVTGSSTIEGSAKRTAKEIAEQLRSAFQRQGWI